MVTKETRAETKGMAQLALLARPFPSVSWKVQATNGKPRANPPRKPTKALLVAFIDARAVQARLDYVFGAEWGNDFKDTPGGILCGITAMGVTRWDAGEEGSGPLGAGPKARCSDALKRAGVEWGIGRFIYDIPAVWVECDEWSKVSETNLTAMTTRYQKWTKNAATVKHYGTPLSHFLEETPQEAAQTPSKAAGEATGPEPQAKASKAVDGVLEPKNTSWPAILVALYSKHIDPDIQTLAAEMLHLDDEWRDHRDVIKAQLQLLSKAKADPIAAILATPSARPDGDPGAFSHAATGIDNELSTTQED